MIQDHFLVDHPNLDVKVALVVRDDHVIEVYAIDEHGLEEFAGRLDHRIGADEEKIRILIKAIRRRVVDRPFTRRAYYWLRGLSYMGLLARWEDPIPPNE